MSSRQTGIARAGGAMLLSLILLGCATTAAPPQAAVPDKLAGERDERLAPGRRVYTREELEAVGGSHDLMRALAILVPGLTISGQ
jgi:hypothetical protein